MEWFGHGFVEVVDEIADLSGQVALGLEVAATDELTHQDGEPDFDLVEPRSVFGCEMEHQGDGQDR